MIFQLIKYFISLVYWQHQPIDRLRKMQLKKFKEVFEYARENSTFYRDLYTKAGVMDLDIQSWEDLEKVPVVDKTVYRSIDFVARTTCPPNSVGINIHTTSGSSGTPLKIAYEKWVDYTGHVRVLYMLWKVAHYTPFSKILMIARYEENEQFKVEKELSLIGKMQKVLHLFEREIVSIYRDPDYIIDRIIESKPKILWATPSVVEIVCNRLLEKNISLTVPFLVLTSEGISAGQYEKFRKCISNHIVAHYGAMESPSISYYDNNPNIANIFANACLVEYIDKENIGGTASGAVVITSLLNKVTPFIRYNLKDYGPVLDREDFPNRYMGPIVGRKDDILNFPDGTCFFHHQAYEMFMDFHECSCFKFVQKGNGPIVLQLVCAPGSEEANVRSLAFERWNKRFSKYPLEIEIKDKFDIDPKTGKFKNIERQK